MALVRTFTRVQAGVLLYVTELLEPAIAIAAFVRFLAGVDPDVLDELVVAGERLEALLALVRLYLVPGDHPARSNADRAQPRQSARNAAASSPRQCTRRAELPRVHLHRALVHEDLREELVRQVVMRMLIRRRYVRRVARMIVGVRSGMVLMLGLRRERLGRRGRCPRPVVRPVAFIGAIHLQGRISSTRPEESLPPSTHGDTKDSDTDMATLIPGRIRDTLDSDSLSATSCCVPRSPAFEMLRGSLEIRRRHASSPFYFIFSSNFLAPNSSTSAPFRLFLPSSSRGGKAGRKKGLVLSDLYHSISLYY